MARVYCFGNILPGTWNMEYNRVEFEPNPQIGQYYQLIVEGKTAIFTILNCSQAQIYYRDVRGSLTLFPLGYFEDLSPWGGGGGGLIWPPPQISATNGPIDSKIGTVVKQVK